MQNTHDNFVYLLARKLYGTLYLGVTNDLGRRIEDHRNGTASVLRGAIVCITSLGTNIGKARRWHPALNIDEALAARLGVQSTGSRQSPLR